MSIQTDIDRGLVLVAQIKRLEEELKQITTRVERVALCGKQIPLEDPERDGMQYLAKGSAAIVPVVITADFLRKSFIEESEPHLEIRATIDPITLANFYTAKTTYERVIDDGKDFRKKAREILEAPKAEAFIKACVARNKDGIPKSAVKVDWQRHRPLTLTDVEVS